MGGQGDGVDAKVIFEARLRKLTRDVSAMNHALERLDPSLRRRVEIRLGTEVARHRREVEALQQGFQTGERHLADSWAGLHALELEVDALVEECLVLLHGSALRTLDLDDGYCILADALIDELVSRTPLGHWSSFTVLGRSEHFRRTSRAIRIRYPGASLWDLPVVAHELGHFVGPMLSDDRGFRVEHPLEELGDRLCGEDEQARSWLLELWADAFGAHMLGPAYGFTSAALGFDPLLAHVADDTHPSGAIRIRAITDTLRGLGNDGEAWAAEQVESLWGRLMQASEVEPPDGGVDPTEEWLPELRQFLADHLPVSGYRGWREAERIADALSDQSHQANVPTSATLADVLNAAWLARLAAPNPYVTDTIEKQARTMCHGIIAEGG